jgi:predicted PolB exonuclease-like 3'-5' exonuclease
VTVLSHFDIPTVALIKKLVALEPSKDPNVKVIIIYLQKQKELLL